MFGCATSDRTIVGPCWISKFSRPVCKTLASTAAGLCLGLLASGPAAAHPALYARAASASVETMIPIAHLSDGASLPGGTASDDVRQMIDWVIDTNDNHGLPFVIVDKKRAEVFIFDNHAKVLGVTAALLGLAKGDDSSPGVGNRKLSEIRPEERTTPAGRFVAALGPSLDKESVLWVDYNTALALHPVPAVNTKEGRLQRLATASPRDKRITFGCINVPARFYDSVVYPTFTSTDGVVYILPEIKSVSEVFFSAR